MSSDQESDKNFENQEEAEDSRIHAKQIIAKAKAILPDYDDQALFQLYKRYYQADQVFLNEVNIIAKRRQENKGQKDQWIFINKGNSTISNENLNKRRYNFLNDRDLIWRAQNWNKESAKPPPRKDRNNFDKGGAQKQSNIKYQQKKGESEIREDKKQMKFKPKEESKQDGKQMKYTEKKEQKSTKKNLNKSQKNGYQEKQVKQMRENKEKVHQKYVEKPKNPSQQQIPEKTTKKYAQKTNKSFESKEPQNPAQNQSPQNQKPKKFQEKKVEQKPAQSEKPIESEKTGHVAAKNEDKPKTSQSIVQSDLPKSQIELNFQKALKLYPKALKFIKPGEKLQKVSYVNNNGSIDQVRVYQPLN